MFWDIPAPWPVWLSGAFSQRKIIANSGRWEAKVRKDGLVEGVGFRMAKIERFWDQLKSWSRSKKTTLGDTPGSPQFGFFLARLEVILCLIRKKLCLFFKESFISFSV
jgi:hypothetical protein